MRSDIQKALSVAVKYKCLYENNNPEVGFGVSANSIVLSVIKDAQLSSDSTFSFIELEHVANMNLR